MEKIGFKRARCIGPRLTAFGACLLSGVGLECCGEWSSVQGIHSWKLPWTFSPLPSGNPRTSKLSVESGSVCWRRFGRRPLARYAFRRRAHHKHTGPRATPADIIP